MGVCNIFNSLSPTPPPHSIPAITSELVLPDSPPERGQPLAEGSTADQEPGTTGSGELDKANEGAKGVCEIERNLKKQRTAPGRQDGDTGRPRRACEDSSVCRAV